MVTVPLKNVWKPDIFLALCPISPNPLAMRAFLSIADPGCADSLLRNDRAYSWSIIKLISINQCDEKIDAGLRASPGVLPVLPAQALPLYKWDEMYTNSGGSCQNTLDNNRGSLL